MAQVTLVEGRIEDGQELLQTLSQSHFAVAAAAWVHPAVEDGWELYIATPGVDQSGTRDAYSVIQKTIHSRPDWSIGLLDVKVIDANSEVGQEMIEMANRKPLKPTFCYGLLGDTEIEEAYVYPANLP